jgi:hypothetical protein
MHCYKKYQLAGALKGTKKEMLSIKKRKEAYYFVTLMKNHKLYLAKCTVPLGL